MKRAGYITDELNRHKAENVWMSNMLKALEHQRELQARLDEEIFKRLDTSRPTK